jgi:hypothetical protein
MDPETKNDCAGEDQQQITALLLANITLNGVQRWD